LTFFLSFLKKSKKICKKTPRKVINTWKGKNSFAQKSCPASKSLVLLKTRKPVYRRLKTGLGNCSGKRNRDETAAISSYQGGNTDSNQSETSRARDFDFSLSNEQEALQKPCRRFLLLPQN
jgi:hypothetical protein